MPARNMEERFRYDERLLDRAEELKYKRKLTWEEVAETLGIPRFRSLKSVVSQRRHGRYGERIKTRDAWKAEIPKVEEKIIAGATVRDLAAQYDVGLRAMHRRLQRIGLDAEMRQELRETGVA